MNYISSTIHAIEMELVDSGPVWDPSQGQWTQEFAGLPTPNKRRLLLVPKVIVRKKLHYDEHGLFAALKARFDALMM